MSKSITTICGRSVLVDEDIYDLYKGYRWRVNHNGSIVCSQLINGKREQTLRNLIIGHKKLGPNHKVYFKDKDILNHTRKNLSLTNVTIVKEGGHYKGILPNGKSFIFDEIDKDIVKSRSWSMTKLGYLISTNNGRREYFHRVALNTPEHLVTDHINGDVKDNRRSNLRVCEHEENMANSRKQLGGKGYTSKFKGVRKERVNRFVVRVRRKNYGTYTSEEAAANVYNHYAKVEFGEFAKINEVGFMSLGECEKYRVYK